MQQFLHPFAERRTKLRAVAPQEDFRSRSSRVRKCPKTDAARRYTFWRLFSTRAHATLFFHGRFYGLKLFRCKTAQFNDAPCKVGSLDSPMKSVLCNAVKTCATR